MKGGFGLLRMMANLADFRAKLSYPLVSSGCGNGKEYGASPLSRSDAEAEPLVYPASREYWAIFDRIASGDLP